MKTYILTIFIILSMVCSLIADEIHMLESEGKQGSYRLFNSLRDNLNYHGLLKNRIMFWGGKHDHLFGYTDRRYIGCENSGSCSDDDADQGDYIKTNSEYLGLELVVSDFGHIYPSFKSGRAGFNISGYKRDELEPKALYAVALHEIPEETVPDDVSGYEKSERWWFNIGVFIGVDKRLYTLDLGLTLKASIVTEEHRQKIAQDSDPENPRYVKGEGRGKMFDESGINLNFLLRLGNESRPHFIMTFNRLDYDLIYGAWQSKLCFPISKYFTFNTGGYLWQTQAVFVEPVISLFDVSMGYKAGIIVNYNDDHFDKAGIMDSIFQSVSLSYDW